MSATTKLICLAASRKLQGVCVAGKELLNEGVGDWIRPVSTSPTGELYLQHIRFRDGNYPELLDIIEMQVGEARPVGCQVENRVNGNPGYWVRAGGYPFKELPRICDNPSQIWSNGYSSTTGLNNRVPENVREASSLMLIRPNSIRLEIVEEWDKRKVKANFEYRSSEYIIQITDPVIEQYAVGKPLGLYPMDPEQTYLCISLGEPYLGFRYKLVAGVISRNSGE